MFNINYNSLLDDDFVFGLTNNVLKTQHSSKNIINEGYGFMVKENNQISPIINDHLILKILNSIHLFRLTKEDPFIIFKMKNEGLLNDNNYDSNLYNTICISILSNENKVLRQQLNNSNSSNKKRKLVY